jgi:hypothetical protein
MKNYTISEREHVIKQFMAALSQVRETELARLLDTAETLAQQLKLISLHNAESPAAAVAARRLIKLWNEEVERILKMRRRNDVDQ